MLKIKKLLIKLIEFFLLALKKAKRLFWKITDVYYVKHYAPPVVKSVEETLELIVDKKVSVSRYGDGEMKLINNKDISFQKASPFVREKMIETLSSDEENHIVCVCDVFGEKINSANPDFWRELLYRYRRIMYKHMIPGKVYYHAGITRPYIGNKNQKESICWINKMKKIWDGREVLLIEGLYSRVGIGNDLLDNAKSVKRILGPEREAFSKYNEIIKEASKFDKDTLVMLALGPCATAMAYDLHKLGFQAVDIGHIDIEYEWALAGSKGKDKIKNKYCNESGVAMTEEEKNYTDEIYESQIIAKII